IGLAAPKLILNQGVVHLLLFLCFFSKSSADSAALYVEILCFLCAPADFFLLRIPLFFDAFFKGAPLALCRRERLCRNAGESVGSEFWNRFSGILKFLQRAAFRSFQSLQILARLQTCIFRRIFSKAQRDEQCEEENKKDAHGVFLIRFRHLHSHLPSFLSADPLRRASLSVSVSPPETLRDSQWCAVTL